MLSNATPLHRLVQLESLPDYRFGGTISRLYANEVLPNRSRWSTRTGADIGARRFPSHHIAATLSFRAGVVSALRPER
jgi:hypothetical protein